jgi:phosphohistidine phosphatase SixA
VKILIYFFCIVFFLSGCTVPRLYIVRHAEKSTEPPKDPDLTEEGKQRAISLSQTLRDKKIKSIYSTKTTRTIETATPLSNSLGIPIQFYKNDTLLKFLYHVLDSGQNALIVGHSNTTIKMLDALELKHTIREIPENDYDNLFVVTLKSNTPAGYKMKLKETVYGKRSPAAGDTSRQAMTSKLP